MLKTLVKSKKRIEVNLIIFSNKRLAGLGVAFEPQDSEAGGKRGLTKHY